MAHQGVETASFGAWLTHFLSADPDYGVYFDHGDVVDFPNVCVTHGFFGTEPKNSNRLAEVDVVVVGPQGDLRLIVEIEERPSSPKKILGDVLALLLCDGFAPGGQRGPVLRPENHTQCIIAGVMPARGDRLTKIERIIQPQLIRLGGLPGSLRPDNITLVFGEDIGSVRRQLESAVRGMFQQSTSA